MIDIDVQEVLVDGRKYRGRQYPWGTVLVEDETHCDFVKLREMLLRTNMQVRGECCVFNN